MRTSELIEMLENSESNDFKSTDFIDFFEKVAHSKNYELQFEFVDSMSRHEFYDDRIFAYLKTELLGNGHYLVKLSILDYLLGIEDKLDSKEIVNILDKVAVLRNRLIVRNQSLLNLIIITDEQKYFDSLLINLLKTSDYRSHIRVYNTIINNDFKNVNEIIKLVEVSNKWNFGNSVKDAIKRVTQHIGSVSNR